MNLCYQKNRRGGLHALCLCALAGLFYAIPASAQVVGADSRCVERTCWAANCCRGVRPSPAPGIIEVQIENGPMLYATDDGGYFFLNGDLHRTNPSGAVNVTEERRSAGRQEQLAVVSIDDMVVFSPVGEVRDYVSVFTDVTCFYCQKLHLEVDELNAKGIEVRYLAFPRGGMNSDGAKKLATAWCAKDDQQTTFTELKAGVELPINDCPITPSPPNTNSDRIWASLARLQLSLAQAR